MKKILSALLICSLPIMAFAKNSDDHFYVKNMYGDVNVKYATKMGETAKKYYMGLHADLSFLNWKNKYSNATESGSDDFSFKSVLGADFVVGYKFDNDMRADIELGYLGKYSESETEYYPDPEKSEFSMAMSYLMANGYYDFDNGLYVGAGLGLSMINVTIDSTWINEKKDSHIAPMGALMFGWSYDLDDSVSIDLRYRFALTHGNDIKIAVGGDYLKTEMGFIMENTLSAGIRYSF